MLVSFPDARRVAFIGALALAAVACASPSTSTPSSAPAKADAPIADTASVDQGKALVQQKGCGGCHTIPGVAGASGTIGPNLGGVASRQSIAGGAVPNHGPDDLKQWILDPPSLRPGTAMPKLGLSDDEATRIVAFLETLK